jgi:hypothetical protein
MSADPPETPPPIQPVTVLEPVTSSSEVSPTPAPRAFVTWWLVKKWAWRNTAAFAWILFLYALFEGIQILVSSRAQEISLPWFPNVSPYHVALFAAFWILLICEFQLTQVLCFIVYLVTLPIWLPCLGFVHYCHHRTGTLKIKKSPFKATAVRISISALFIAVFFWWPLPCQFVAIVLAIVALPPGVFFFVKPSA